MAVVITNVACTVQWCCNCNVSNFAAPVATTATWYLQIIRSLSVVVFDKRACVIIDYSNTWEFEHMSKK